MFLSISWCPNCRIRDQLTGLLSFDTTFRHHSSHLLHSCITCKRWIKAPYPAGARGTILSCAELMLPLKRPFHIPVKQRFIYFPTRHTVCFYIGARKWYYIITQYKHIVQFQKHHCETHLPSSDKIHEKSELVCFEDNRGSTFSFRHPRPMLPGAPPAPCERAWLLRSWIRWKKSQDVTLSLTHLTHLTHWLFGSRRAIIACCNML